MASKMRCELPCLEARRRMIGFGKIPTVGTPNIQSWELLHCIQPDLVNDIGSIDVEHDMQSLLKFIPRKFLDLFYTESASQDETAVLGLRDIIFDIGVRPYAYFGQRKRVYLSCNEDMKTTQEDMNELMKPLENKFGMDNRAGIDGSLHRISAMRSKNGEAYGLTYRVGRSVKGNTGLIKDILQNPNLSILIMGSPGSGKTTVIREIAKQLSAAEDNVVVVDTSNEICGDGIVPHTSVGMARRMMVPNLDMQASVLIEAVQNHTPDVIICDEIGRKAEVEAMQTVKERGVRCVASAHGNLRSLVANKQLDGLIGGIETVTVGDGKAIKDQNKFGGAFSKVIISYDNHQLAY